MHIELYKARQHADDNLKYLNMISYYLAKREFDTVKNLINNVNKFTKCENMANRVKGLFFMDKRAKEYFGIAEDIVGSMTNMVFGGDVTLKSEQKNTEKIIDRLYVDGDYIDTIIDTYKTAISTNGKAYLFYKLDRIYNAYTLETINYEFIGYDIVPEFELKVKNNSITRTFVEKRYNVLKKEDEYYTFDYIYKIINNKSTLEIIGFDEQNVKLSDSEVKRLLEINTTNETYPFRVYDVLKLDDGMLPNILWIENSLAENLYFQDVDLPNSQTQVYIAEDQLLDVYNSSDRLTKSFDDKYQTTKIVKSGGIDARESMATVVEGKSAISFIERNLALNVIQACLDAKISPISIGYSLVEKMINNTDVGADKERVSIRLRESHIDKLKVFMAKVLQMELEFKGYKVPLEKLSIMFAQYITPSIESLTNTLAKQVQFGIKSREQAVRELARGELTEEEVKAEIDRILLASTQQDYNSNVISNNEKGIDNVLKSDGIVE